MQGYSLNGYVNAVLRRAGKTLLIEGSSDKTILNRIRLEKNLTGQNGTIDCVEILSDQSLAGQGNRVRIKNTENHFRSLSAAISERVDSKFSCLIDREWDNVDISTGIPTVWTPPIQNSNSYATLGHSIENYLFCPYAVASQIKFLFPNQVTAQFLKEIENRFLQIIAISVAYSITLHNHSCIKRADGLITKDDVKWNGTTYELDSSYDDRAFQREITTVPNLHIQVNQLTGECITKHATHMPGKWICHGHLGEQVIWACVGSIALELGLPENQAREIERGSKENRIKCAADHLSKAASADREPLDSIIEWLDT